MEQEPFRIPRFVEISLLKCRKQEVQSVQEEIAQALARGIAEDEISKRATDAGWEPSVAKWLIAFVRENGPQELIFTPSTQAAKIDPIIASNFSDLKKIEGHLAEIKGWARFFGVLTTLSIVLGIGLVIYEIATRQGR